MWSFKAPAAVLGLLAVTLFSPVAAKPYPLPTARVEEPRDLQNASNIEKRQCAGTPCGYYKQLCCTGSQVCMTNSNNEAVCGVGGQATNGWSFYTSVGTDVITKTAVYSTYVGSPNPQATGTCPSQWDSPCGAGLCCGVGYYCATIGTCKLNGGSTGGIIATGSPTATLPFSTPIPTGVNGTLLPQEGGGGGLSGGAIAGIVIGVLLGILLLLLICFYCCAKSLFDTLLACFGIGKKNRKHTHEETYIEEHHHSSGGAAAAAGGGRRWYGQAPSRQSRTKKSGGMGGLLGAGAALGGLALALGLKRKHDRKEDDKTTTYTGSSAYYSDYTSSSSASSSDRRSRPTRHSSRR